MTQEESFDELYRTHYRRVFRLCRKLLGTSDQAEDATQEVFLKAHRAFKSYDREQAFAGWILKIASNFCVDVVRRRTKEQQLFGDQAVEEQEIASDSPTAVWSAHCNATGGTGPGCHRHASGEISNTTRTCLLR